MTKRRKKRSVCEGGYSKADAEREASRLRSRGYTVTIRTRRFGRNRKIYAGHDYTVCWKR